MMPKKITVGIGFFLLLFVPVLALSFFAYTVFHQIILVASLAIAAWAAVYIARVVIDRDRLGREVFQQSYELKKAKEALESCLAVDTKTHVYNARLLDSRLTEECDRARRYQRPLSFLMVSVDSLSRIFEEHGSKLGGVVVQEVMQFLKDCTRSVDIIIRRGEGRFVVILPETHVNQGRIAAERIRYAIEKNTFRIEQQVVKVTVSVGICGFNQTIHRGKDDILSALEKALEKATAAGPNKIAALAGEAD